MDDRGVARRSFMIRVIIGIVAFIGAVLAVPFGGFTILPALRKRQPGWSDAGTWSDLAVNEPQERRFSLTVKSGWQEEKQERSVWLVRKPDNTISAFSPNCPHLGCGYRWFDSDRLFKCPCHGSVFDIDGKIISGPAPRSLDALSTKVEGDRLYVRYEVFQLGISQKMTA